MTIYAFDEVGDSLHLVPVAARRALDAAGCKLSLAGWRSLPVERRRSLVGAGLAEVVDEDAVRRLAGGADPPPSEVARRGDPAADHVPGDVREAFGPERPLDDALWAALTRLDRFALAKAAAKRRPERLQRVWDEIVGASATSTHLAPQGGARMVSVAQKRVTLRRAVAESRVTMNEEAFTRLSRAEAPKGDVLGTARVAGILAAKRTSELVPLCHPVAITRVALDFVPEVATRSVRVTATVEALDRTGVEMEALTAVSTAALTVYDMLKAFDRTMEIGPTRVTAKAGGRSGDWER